MSRLDPVRPKNPRSVKHRGRILYCGNCTVGTAAASCLVSSTALTVLAARQAIRRRGGTVKALAALAFSAGFFIPSSLMNFVASARGHPPCGRVHECRPRSISIAFLIQQLVLRPSGVGSSSFWRTRFSGGGGGGHRQPRSSEVARVVTRECRPRVGPRPIPQAITVAASYAG